MLLDRLYITNYRESGREALQSVTRLSREEALKTAAKLAPFTHAKRNRFCEADFPGYYEKRLRVEAWLYAEFARLGGKPVQKHPLYFVLGESEYLRKWFGEGEAIRLPLAMIPESAISFTLCDSMNDKNAPGVGKLYTKRSLFAVIDTYPSLNDFWAYIERYHHYVEAQLWEDSLACTPRASN